MGWPVTLMTICPLFLIQIDRSWLIAERSNVSPSLLPPLINSTPLAAFRLRVASLVLTGLVDMVDTTTLLSLLLAVIALALMVSAVVTREKSKLSLPPVSVTVSVPKLFLNW